MAKEVCVRLAGDLAVGPSMSSYGLGEVLDDRDRGTGFYVWIAWRWGEAVKNLDFEHDRGELRDGDCVLVVRRAEPMHNRACWRPKLLVPRIPVQGS